MRTKQNTKIENTKNRKLQILRPDSQAETKILN